MVGLSSVSEGDYMGYLCHGTHRNSENEYKGTIIPMYAMAVIHT